MSDETWKTTFTVKERLSDKVNGTDPRWVFDVINIHNGVVVGTYREQSYAQKQARRKHKKLVKLMEKTFMSLA